jgi:hypothetical protein
MLYSLMVDIEVSGRDLNRMFCPRYGFLGMSYGFRCCSTSSARIGDGRTSGEADSI